MNAIHNLAPGRLLVAVTLALVATDIAPTTCPAGKTPTLAIAPRSLGERDIFNVRFKQVNIQACKIWDVIILLVETIEKSSGGKRHFAVGLESSLARKYLDERVPPSQWNLDGPKISLVGSNMTLEAIINALCLQAGWSYDDHTPVGTMFTDSKRFPKPKR